jgi:hypothetical protein
VRFAGMRSLGLRLAAIDAMSEGCDTHSRDDQCFEIRKKRASSWRMTLGIHSYQLY